MDKNIKVVQNSDMKLLIFDFDGVLADCKNMHYEALNKSIETIDKSYCITREEHLST